MTYPLVRLVDSPDPSATVRYDFSDDGALAPRAVLADSFTLGAPSLDSPFDAVSSVYGPRALGFTHQIQGLKTDALSALAVLSRELLRPSSWLLVQVDAFTRPTFWRLYATGPGAVSWDDVYVETATGDPGSLPDRWQIPVTLTAESFGYGEWIALDPVTVTQTPDGPYPMRVALPTIHGDAPTALRVEVTSAADTDTGVNSEWLVACLSGGADVDVTLVDIGTGDGVTPSDVSGDPVTDAAYFGGSYRPLVIPAATALVDAPFLLGGFAGLPPGRYQAWVRNNRDALDQSYLMRLDITTTAGAWTLLTAGGETEAEGWSLLGEFQFPLGSLLPDDLDLAASGGETFKVYATTPDGVAGEVRVDSIAFVPVDVRQGRTTALRVRFTADQTIHWGTGAAFSVDGDAAGSGLVWLTFAGDLIGAHSPVVSGGFPVADPAAERNVLVVMATDKGTDWDFPDNITSLGTAFDVTVSYHPRLLHLDGRP